MSILVKGMKMPKTCYDCIAEVADDDILSFYCPFIYKGYTDKYRKDGRHPDCPLVEVEDDDGWIPTSERLPEENGEYLVTRESVFYRYIDIVRKSNCNSDLPMASDIKAWMPLPKPYEPKEGK